MIERFMMPRFDSSSPVGRLSEDETNAIVAFAEVLVEGRTLPAAERGHIIDHINYRTERTQGYLPLYRMTANVLDRLAHTRFAALDLQDRKRAMVRSGIASYPVKTTEYLLPIRRENLAVRFYIVPDLIAGYYRSPAGWASVGYKAFPSRCNNLIRYTRPEV